jgi:hypothetical protein
MQRSNPSGNHTQHAVPAPLNPVPNRLTTGWYPHIRVWLWQSQTGTPTSANKPGTAAALRAGRGDQGEHGERHVWGEGGDARRTAATGPPPSGCSSSPRSPPRAAKRGQTGGKRVPASRFRSASTGLVHSLPEKPGSTRPGPAELSTPASFTFARTCVPASPILLEELSARIGACSCRNFLAAGNSRACHVAAQATPSHGFLLPRLSPTLPSSIPACRCSGTQ